MHALTFLSSLLSSDNHHHPKSSEIIRAGHCDGARRNKTSKWIAMNKSTMNTESGESSSTPAPTPSPPVLRSEVNGDGSYPPVQALGKEWCDEHLCGVCQGDCDDDSQCAGDLKCFQRDGGMDVPGCSGGRDSHSRTDYCYDPNYASVPTNVVAPAEVPELDVNTVAEDPELDMVDREYCQPDNQCGLCQGDCDTDDDCAGDLVCHQRGKNDSIPGCRGGSDDGSQSDYCVNP